MSNAANEVGQRFRDEREYIERYVRLLRAKSTLHDRQVYDLNRILQRVRPSFSVNRSITEAIRSKV